jgi:hypothetical protein
MTLGMPNTFLQMYINKRHQAISEKNVMEIQGVLVDYLMEMAPDG